MSSIPYIPRVCLSFVFFLTVSLHLTAKPDSFLIVNLGHDAQVSALAMNGDGSIGFSGDEVGVLKVWNTAERKNVRRIRTGIDPIIRITAHPLKEEVALIEEQASGTYRLSVWNWRDGRLTFARTLDDVPLSMSYSPEGTFLTISVPQWRSLRFFDTEGAQELPWLEDGFGIVNTAVVSNSERRVMAYSGVNGGIKYFELQSGELAHETQTEESLALLTLLANRRHALGYKNQVLYLLDLLTGKTLAQSRTGEIRAIIPINMEKNQFYIVSQSARQNLLRPITVQTGARSSIQIQRNTLTIPGVDISYASGGNRTLVTVNKHEIGLLEGRAYSPVSSVEVDKFQSVLTHDKWIYVQTYAGISRFLYSVLQEPWQGSVYVSPADPPVQNLKLPFRNPGGMAGLDAHSFITWAREEIRHIYEFNSMDDTFRSIPVQLLSTVRTLRVGARYIIILDNNDGLYVLSRDADYEQVFTYRSVGMMDAMELPDGNILIGRRKSDFLATSIIELDPRTGEIEPLPSEDDVVFNLAPSARGFFSLGIGASGNDLYTTLRRFSNGRAGSSSPIMRFAGEDRNADMYYISSNASLLTSLGFEGISRYQNQRLNALEFNNNLPRRVYGDDRFIIAINDDGSASLWDSSTREMGFQIISLPDAGLILLFPDFAYLTLDPKERRRNHSRLFSVQTGTEAAITRLQLSTADLQKLKNAAAERAAAEQAAAEQAAAERAAAERAAAEQAAAEEESQE